MELFIIIFVIVIAAFATIGCCIAITKRIERIEELNKAIDILDDLKNRF